MSLYQDKNASPADRAEDLLKKMSYEEKVAQLSGYNPAGWSADDFEKDYPLGAGQVSFFAGTEKRDIYEAAAFQRELQEKIMERSPPSDPCHFPCGNVVRGDASGRHQLSLRHRTGSDL